MAENIPQDPFSIDRSIPFQADSYSFITEDPLSVSDSLETFQKEEVSTRLTARNLESPSLPTPKTGDYSFGDFFKAINDAIQGFRRMRAMSSLANQETRIRARYGAIDQVRSLMEIQESRLRVINSLKEEINQKIETLREKFEEMQKLLEGQKELIEKLQAGDAEEKRQYQNLEKAYQDYIESLQSIGVIDQGDGTFLIPEGAKETYNQLTQEYQEAVKTFQDYWKERSSEIEAYNKATNAYNQSVNLYHQFLNSEISQDLKEQGISVPFLEMATLRDFFDSSLIQTPSLIDSLPPLTIPSISLPSSLSNLAEWGPPKIPPLSSFPSFDFDLLYDVLYQKGYDKEIAPLDQGLKTTIIYWSLLIQQRIDELLNDSLLNTKPLTQKLFPSFLFDTPPSLTKLQANSASLGLQSIGLHQHNLQVLLGRLLLKQAIQEAIGSDLNKEDEIFDKKVEEIADQILILSVTLLGNQSPHALFPALSKISHLLPSLPKDSPAFPLLFVLSFSHEIQKEIKEGGTEEALQIFAKKIPELAALPPEKLKKIAAVLNLGQLFVVNKLIEIHLGLPGLLGALLPSLIEGSDTKELFLQAFVENRKELKETAVKIRDHFISQGYGEEEAEFLGNFAVEIAERDGLLTPSLPSQISQKSVDIPLLTHSLKAELILAHYPLEIADGYASQITEKVLTDSPYPSPEQFRSTLETHLNDLKIRNSKEIAKGALLFPSQDIVPSFLPARTETLKSLSSNLRADDLPDLGRKEIATPLQTDSISLKRETTNQEISHIPLFNYSLPELIALTEKRSLDLLSPHLGYPLAKQFSQEIAQTLFGSSENLAFDSSLVPQLPSSQNATPPTDSLFHMIKRQMALFSPAKDPIHESFKETMKTMESTYYFLLKLMSPASYFLFSTIFHGNKEKLKNIDIPI